MTCLNHKLKSPTILRRWIFLQTGTHCPNCEMPSCDMPSRQLFKAMHALMALQFTLLCLRGQIGHLLPHIVHCLLEMKSVVSSQLTRRAAMQTWNVLQKGSIESLARWQSADLYQMVNVKLLLMTCCMHWHTGW